MRIILLLLTLTTAYALPAQQRGEIDRASLDPKVSQFAVNEISAIQALLQLSLSERVPMGIVEDDDRLCKSEVTYSARNVPTSAVVKSILAQVPGYTWRRSQDSAVFLITPVAPRSVTTQFLQLVDPRFGPTKDTLQGLEVTLWVHILYLLYPEKGTAGSILNSTNARLYELEAKDATVQQILDRMAALTKGAWVLRPLPSTLANLTGNLPFSIFSDDSQVPPSPADLCVPTREEVHH